MKSNPPVWLLIVGAIAWLLSFVLFVFLKNFRK